MHVLITQVPSIQFSIDLSNESLLTPGREVMGCEKGSVKLYASKPVLNELEKRAVMGKKPLEPLESVLICSFQKVFHFYAFSSLDPFTPVIVEDGKSIELGPGVKVEFHRVPHREEECGQTHGIVVRGEERSIFFLPDHDFYDKTLEWQKMDSLRQWFKHLAVNIVLIDGTFYTKQEVAGRRKDASGIPHPSLKESLELLGNKQTSDPEIIFIHLNHTNTVIDDPTKQAEVEALGWHIGKQGQVFEI